MTHAKVAELLSDLAAKVGEEVHASGAVGRAQAKNIGNRVAKRMAREWGGQQLYFPHGVLWDIDERDMEIFERFDGSNQDELAADIQRKANRDEVAPKAHTHRAAEITDFAEAVAALAVHQKIGTFDIYKDPGGRMIQAGTVQVLNHNNQMGGRILTWPVAFVDTPHVVLTLSGKDINVVDVFITYDHTRTDRNQVCYWIYENATNKAAEVTVNFVAVGRWK